MTATAVHFIIFRKEVAAAQLLYKAICPDRQMRENERPNDGIVEPVAHAPCREMGKLVLLLVEQLALSEATLMTLPDRGWHGRRPLVQEKGRANRLLGAMWSHGAFPALPHKSWTTRYY